MKNIILALLVLCTLNTYAVSTSLASASPVNIYFFDGHDQKGNTVIGLGYFGNIPSTYPQFEAHILDKDNQYIYAQGIYIGAHVFAHNDSNSYLLNIHPWMITQERVCMTLSNLFSGTANRNLLNEVKLFHPDSPGSWLNTKKAQFYGYLVRLGIATKEQDNFYYQYKSYNDYGKTKIRDLILYLNASQGFLGDSDLMNKMANNIYTEEANFGESPSLKVQLHFDCGYKFVTQ